MVVYYPFSCMYAHPSVSHSNDHHTCNSSFQVYLNNAENKRQASLNTRLYPHKLFHPPTIYTLDYNHSNNSLVYQHIYVHIDLFQLWHIHQHYNVTVHPNHQYNLILYYKLNDSQCIHHLYKKIVQLDMYCYLSYSQLHRNDHRNHLHHRNDKYYEYI